MISLLLYSFEKRQPPLVMKVFSQSLTSHSLNQHKRIILFGAKRYYEKYNYLIKNRFRYPAYTEHMNKGHGWPLMWVVTSTKPSWQPHLEEEYEVVARDEYGVPMQVTF